MKFLRVEYVTSKHDKYGNSYVFAKLANRISYEEVHFKGYGATGNLRSALFDLCGKDWEVVREFVDEIETELPIRRFNAESKGLPNVPCQSSEICEWLFNYGILPNAFEMAKAICESTGAPIDHHESDMYLPDVPVFRMLDKYNCGTRAKCGFGKGTPARRFTSNIEGKPWLDFPFAYRPAFAK